MATEKKTRRWVAALPIISDLVRAQGKVSAALEAAQPDGKATPLADHQPYIDSLTAAVTALDSAIAIAQKNLPKTKPIAEDLPHGL
jgi:hypothetical protein